MTSGRKGIINDSTNCFVRKGIESESQYALSSLINVIENDNIKNNSDINIKLLSILKLHDVFKSGAKTDDLIISNFINSFIYFICK